MLDLTVLQCFVGVNGFVTASFTANQAPGAYSVMASATALAPVSSSVTNLSLLTNVIAGSPSITYNPATQTVMLTATVTSTGGTVNAGTVNFALMNPSGLMTSSTVSNGTVSATMAIPAGMPAGLYQFTASYTGAGTYAASVSAPADLTINRALASVTPNAASKTNGTSDPAFTGALSGLLAADGVTTTYSRTASFGDPNCGEQDLRDKRSRVNRCAKRVPGGG